MVRCLAKVNVPISKKRNLGPNTVDCIFLQYVQRSIAYRFLAVKILLWSLVMQYFFENMFPMKDMHNTSRFSSEIIPKHVAPIESSEQPHEDVIKENIGEAPRRSKRQRIGISIGDDFTVYLVDDTPI